MHSQHDVSCASFWQQRYNDGYTGWDLGCISPPLQAYFMQLSSPNQRILIIGAGNAHEASYLHRHGFDDVYVLDFARHPLEQFANKHTDFPKSHLLHHDFFELDQVENAKFVGFFDIVIEQTFLCAIDPRRRHDYVQQVHCLLKDTGKLVGVVFDCQFEHSPPFGGSLSEYQALFSPYFDIQVMTACHNSVRSRAGNELFIKLTKA